MIPIRPAAVALTAFLVLGGVGIADGCPSPEAHLTAQTAQQGTELVIVGSYWWARCPQIAACPPGCVAAPCPPPRPPRPLDGISVELRELSSGPVEPVVLARGLEAERDGTLLLRIRIPDDVRVDWYGVIVQTDDHLATAGTVSIRRGG